MIIISRIYTNIAILGIGYETECCTLIVSLVRGVVLCSVLVYALPLIFGEGAIWWVMSITETVIALYVVLSIIRIDKVSKIRNLS